MPGRVLSGSTGRYRSWVRIQKRFVTIGVDDLLGDVVGGQRRHRRGRVVRGTFGGGGRSASSAGRLRALSVMPVAM